MTEGGWFKDLVAPGLLIFLTALATFLFGKQKYDRDRSNTKLNEAQDTQQVNLLAVLRDREQEAQRRANEANALHMQARDELYRTREAMNGELASMRAVGERRDMLLTRQAKQLAMLARMVGALRPELRDIIEESGFVSLDAGEMPVRRKTDPAALPGPISLDFKEKK